MDHYAISVEELTRQYQISKGFLKLNKKKVDALNGISFNVKKGEIFGLLGPNGAGKTTTIKILTTLLAPTSGVSKVLGYNTFGEEKEIRKKINFIFGGELGVYRRLTGRENLLYFANLYQVKKEIRDQRINELLDWTKLKEKEDLKVETYSKGMIQRLQIARGLINNPEIIFLDEPTLGLDPIGARELRELVKELAARGTTVLLTTHYMYEADELCDRIAIINKGRILALDTPGNLKNNVCGVSILEISTHYALDDCLLEQIRRIAGVEQMDIEQKDLGYDYRVHHDCNYAIMQEVMSLVSEQEIIRMNQRSATLEDVYVRLVGGSK